MPYDFSKPIDEKQRKNVFVPKSFGPDNPDIMNTPPIPPPIEGLNHPLQPGENTGFASAHPTLSNALYTL